MATFNKHNQFIADVFNGVHDMSSDTLKVALFDTAPTAANSVLADIVANELANGNGYTTGGETVGITSSTQTGGTYTLVDSADDVWTASGSMGPFRYVDFYNDTPTSPANPLIGWWDYGSDVTLASSETFTVQYGASILSAS